MSAEAAAPATPFLAVVRRGDEQAYRFVQERFSGEQLVEVRWDARVRDRRATAQVLLPERRRKDRRGPVPGTWGTLGFVLVPIGGRTNGGGNGTGRRVDGATAPAYGSARSGTAVRMGPAPAAARIGTAVREGPEMLQARPSRLRAASHPVTAEPAEAVRPSAAGLAGAAVLVRAGDAVFPSFYDAVLEGWRCGRCGALLRARELPRRGDSCRVCQAAVVRVLRWRWQRVNWVALATLAFLALLASRIAWPLLSATR